MGPEFWVTVVAAFVGGGAIGSAGTLFAQWLLRSVDGPEPRRKLNSSEMDMLRADIHDISRHVHNLDARLDFQERLLGGSLTASPQPQRLPPRDDEAAPEDEPPA